MANVCASSKRKEYIVDSTTIYSHPERLCKMHFKIIKGFIEHIKLNDNDDDNNNSGRRIFFQTNQATHRQHIDNKNIVTRKSLTPIRQNIYAYIFCKLAREWASVLIEAIRIKTITFFYCRVAYSLIHSLCKGT